MAAEADTFLAAGDVGDGNCSLECEDDFLVGVFSEVLRDGRPDPPDPVPPAPLTPAADSYTNT